MDQVLFMPMPAEHTCVCRGKVPGEYYFWEERRNREAVLWNNQLI
jgi:hypothetical protein